MKVQFEKTAIKIDWELLKPIKINLRLAFLSFIVLLRERQNICNIRSILLNTNRK